MILFFIFFVLFIRYPLEQARQSSQFKPTNENILQFLNAAKKGDSLKKSLVCNVPFGALLLDHVFIKIGVPLAAQVIYQKVYIF